MADASVEGPPMCHQKFLFEKKFLDVYDDDTHIRLDSLIRRGTPIVGGADRILQMDIEGAEYKVLMDASDDVLASFRLMIIEFHNLDGMFSKLPFDFIQATFKKLLRFHSVIHIHPNNVCEPTIRKGVAIPPVMEFTFYRTDFLPTHRRPVTCFPHPLDRDNVLQKKSVILPDCWIAN